MLVALPAAADDAAPPAAPAATVPAPRALSSAELETPPCWSCLPETEQVPRLRTDLDAIAPLGTGTGNAATWFASFSGTPAPRAADLSAARKRREEAPVRTQGSSAWFLADDPVVQEGAGWADQATFHVELGDRPWPGPDDPLPVNVLLAIQLVKAWVQHGDLAQSPDVARDDYRRCIRLGRLLLQDDQLWTQSRIGRQCIRHGALALHRRALKDGTPADALVADRVLAEVDGALLLDRLMDEELDLREMIVRDEAGVRLAIPALRLKRLVATARTSGDRSWRTAAIGALRSVKNLAPAEEAKTAADALDALAADKDAVVAAAAKWAATTPWEAREATVVADGQ
jgi:hypothetical protein